jgi:hypothetical protein
VFSRNAGQVNSVTESQMLPEALEWLWTDYRPHRF